MTTELVLPDATTNNKIAKKKKNNKRKLTNGLINETIKKFKSEEGITSKIVKKEVPATIKHSSTDEATQNLVVKKKKNKKEKRNVLPIGKPKLEGIKNKIVKKEASDPTVELKIVKKETAATTIETIRVKKEACDTTCSTVSKSSTDEAANNIVIKKKNKRNKKNEIIIDTLKKSEGVEPKIVIKQDSDATSDPDKKPKKKNKKKKVKNDTIRVPVIKSEEPPEYKNDYSKENVNSTSETNSKPAKVNVKRFVLFIGNLPFQATEEQLKEHFKVLRNGILEIRLLTDPKTGIGRGCGFLEVKDQETYQIALKMHSSTFQERKIRVQFTVPGKSQNSKRKKFIKSKTKQILGQKKNKKKK